nr:alpha/beta fold hydrolase [Elizabethkingia bruuniana]
MIYFYQEKIIFHPEKLPENYSYNFGSNTEEITIITRDNKRLNSVLFKAPDSKGVIFYLHGNGGSIKGWSEVAKLYNSMNYDVYMLDYRGYGKSEGSIESKDQIFSDVERAYEEIKNDTLKIKLLFWGIL